MLANNRLGYVSISFLLGGLSGPVLAQRDTVPRTVIGAPANLEREVIVAAGAQRPLRTRLFTTAEIVERARQAQKLRNLRRGQQVRTAKGWVGLATYLDEINAWEAWLNRYGYSLRTPQPKVLPLRFKLRPYGSGAKAPIIDPKPRVPGIFKNPEIRDPHEPAVIRPGDELMRDPRLALDRIRLREFAGKPTIGVQTGVLRGAGGLPSLPGIPTTTPMKGGAPCPDTCTLSYGSNSGQATLSPIGSMIVNNDWYTWTCGVAGPGAEQQCKGGTIVEKKDGNVLIMGVRAREKYRDLFPSPAAMDDFIKNHENVCDMKAKLPAFGSLYQLPPASSGGKWDTAQGQKAADFYGGLLRLTGANILDCVGKVSDNGWFGGSFCLGYEGRANYTVAKGFDLADTAGVDASVTLFGQDFTLAEGNRQVAWQQTLSEPPKKTPTVTGKVSFLEDSKRFETPPVVVPIGPVPLSITAGIDAMFNVGSTPAIYDENGIARLVKKQKPAIGRVGAGIGANAQVTLFMEAAVDAYIVSAGIDAKLNVLKATVDGSIQSIVDAPGNLATIRKSYGFGGEAFAGSISAFVEVDAIVYTKRWSIELVDFDGIQTDYKPVTVDHTASAILPATEQASVCPG